MLSFTLSTLNASHSSRLSNRESHLVHRIVDGPPRLLRRLKHDLRVGYDVAELLDRYRQELIEAVQSGVEASLLLVPEFRSSAAPGESADVFARDGLHTSSASLSLAGEDDADSRRAMAWVRTPHDVEIDPARPSADQVLKAIPDDPAAYHAQEILRRTAPTVSVAAGSIHKRRRTMTPLKCNILVTYSSIITVLVLSLVGSFVFGLYW